MLARLIGHGPRHVPSGHVDFAAAGLPEYNGCYATVIDSLFSKPELSAVLAEAEAFSPWEIAQVNAGTMAYTNTSYRNGQRIIYDSFELSEKIFEKVRPHLSDIEEIEHVTYINGHKMMQKWRMVRLNERLRFLRYPEGGFFRKHIDGCYENEENGQRTFYTLQFYLPSDTTGSHESFLPAKGGTTRFIGRKGNYADVEAKPGRVLVFQHASLMHTGEEVTGGVKCAVRSDILYEKVGNPVPVKK
ncbi:alcohol dehydrogenase [Mycena venus]|uniref:Alcohol dehydrogenase n=1 Tax=Mycena venus TaxID=2733690 RepID=A0A8H7CTZ7_9AGAR|nr:alcohol dehydrogenase [Mycena venus]